MSESIGNSPKRVLFWTEAFHPHVGGIERFAQELMAALQPRGYEFTVITGALEGSPPEENYRGVRVCRLPLRKGLSGSTPALKNCLEKIQSLKTELQPTLTHLNTHGPSFLYHFMTRNVQPHPTLFTFHFDVEEGSPRESLGKILNISDKVTAVSQDTLNKALRIFPEIAGKSSVIHNGRAFPPEGLNGLRPEPMKFFCWGRLAANKGFHVALQAFARVAPVFPEAHLVLAGEGPERRSLEEKIKSLGLGPRVGMPGFLEESVLEAELQSSAAVLVPSFEQECFGFVALEAMQRGKPVIASRYGGLSEVVEDGRSGILFAPGNAEDLAEAMIRLGTDPKRAAAMGEAGRRLATEKFSLEKMAGSYEALYQSVSSKERLSRAQGSP